MKKLTILFAVVVLSGISASAQHEKWYLKNVMTLNWEIATPTDAKYLKETSLAGGSIEFRHFLNEKLSIGAAIHWNSFDQYVPAQVYEKPDGSAAIYTDMVWQVYTVPMMATAHYYFDAGKMVKPYVGIGIGGNYSEQSVYYNVFVSDEDNWGFVARPEVGALIKMGKYAGFNVSVGYNYATNENPAFKVKDLKHIGFSIGGFWNVF